MKIKMWFSKLTIIKNPRHLFFLLLGILGLAILSGMTFFYWHYYTTDELAELTPEEVALFVQIKKPILFSHAVPLNAPQLAALYQSLDNCLAWNLDWQKDVLPLVNKQVAMIVTANNQLVIVFKTTDREIAEERFKNYNHFWLKKNIIALADESFDLAEVFKNTKEKNLTAKLGERFKPFGLFKVYLNLAQLPAVVSQFSGGNFGENLLYKKFAQFKDLVAIINWRSEAWRFKLIPGLINFSEEKSGEQPEILITHLPADYLFFGRGLSVEDLINFNFLNNDLSFNYLKDELLPLADNNFNLLIFPGLSSKRLNYVLAFKLKEQRITQPPPPADSTDDLFEEKFKKFVALNWPQRVVKILPDKSRVGELVANPDYYQFEALSDDIYYFANKNWEVGYQKKGDIFIVSNSKPYLLEEGLRITRMAPPADSADDLLDQNKWKTNLATKIKNCWLDYPAKFLLWQQDFGLGFKEVLLKLDRNFVFSGCLH